MRNDCDFLCFLRTCQNLPPKMSQSDTHMPTRLTHTHMIQHMKTFLRQPIICNIKYCTKINYHNIHNYKQARFTRHHTILHTHIFKHTKTFYRHPVNCTINILQNRTVTIYKTTHTHTLHTPLYTLTYNKIYITD